MIQLLVWKNVCLTLRKILTLIALSVSGYCFLKLGFLLKVYVGAFQSICPTYLLANWYVAGQGKSCGFHVDVNLFPSKPETWVLVDSPMTEGNRWSVILVETWFFVYKLYCKFLVFFFVWLGFFFHPVHREEQGLWFSVVLCNISKGFSQAHVPGAFFTFMSHILLILCYFSHWFLSCSASILLTHAQ